VRQHGEVLCRRAAVEQVLRHGEDLRKEVSAAAGARKRMVDSRRAPAGQ
jgi:hypothetical protein